MGMIHRIHEHPKWQSDLGLDYGHVIVDRDAFERALHRDMTELFGFKEHHSIDHLRTVNAKLVEALEEMLKVTQFDVPCSENSRTIARGMSMNALKLAKGE